jgi:hypothetical protein
MILRIAAQRVSIHSIAGHTFILPLLGATLLAGLRNQLLISYII